MALMDETACWVMMVKVGTAGFTQTMRFSFLKHVYVNQKEIQIRGKLVEIKGGIAYIELRILGPRRRGAYYSTGRVFCCT